jgi:glycosyltransferase involved in cell wall biosynthesis
MIDLSVVVIGKNEAATLPALMSSLKDIKPLCSCEFIYVDSASSDNSVNIAQSFFDVYILSEHKNLCASAGRFVGTEKAKGEWILYLDGDMTLESEFIEPMVKHIRENNTKVGLEGIVDNIFDDGTMKSYLAANKEGANVTHFGGAVLLPSVAVKRENWNPCIYCNEEIELFTRLQENGITVKFVKKKFVKHFTPKIPKYKVLLGIFFPKNSCFGKQYYGIGQAVAARVQNNTLMQFIYWFSEPFVLWAGVICFFIGSFFSIPYAFIILVSSMIYTYLFIVFAKSYLGL